MTKLGLLQIEWKNNKLREGIKFQLIRDTRNSKEMLRKCTMQFEQNKADSLALKE